MLKKKDEISRVQQLGKKLYQKFCNIPMSILGSRKLNKKSYIHSQDNTHKTQHVMVLLDQYGKRYSESSHNHCSETRYNT